MGLPQHAAVRLVGGAGLRAALLLEMPHVEVGGRGPLLVDLGRGQEESRLEAVLFGVLVIEPEGLLRRGRLGTLRLEELQEVVLVHAHEADRPLAAARTRLRTHLRIAHLNLNFKLIS